MSPDYEQDLGRVQNGTRTPQQDKTKNPSLWGLCWREQLHVFRNQVPKDYLIETTETRDSVGSVISTQKTRRVLTSRLFLYSSPGKKEILDCEALLRLYKVNSTPFGSPTTGSSTTSSDGSADKSFTSFPRLGGNLVVLNSCSG